jgi:hypothetical protein
MKTLRMIAAVLEQGLDSVGNPADIYRAHSDVEVQELVDRYCNTMMMLNVMTIRCESDDTDESALSEYSIPYLGSAFIAVLAMLSRELGWFRSCGIRDS